MIRPFIIDDETRAQVAKIVAYAQSHWYRPGRNAPPPGDDPRHTVTFAFGYRCVFSFTFTNGRLFRHLSVSVPSEHYPNEITFFAIAELFGFTGWSVNVGGDPPKDWILNVSQEEHCIVAAQEIKR